MGRLRDGFAVLVAAGDRADLGRAALEIARLAYPELDPAPYLRQLDILADRARPRVEPLARTVDAARELAAYLFGECGFCGNQDDYYDPRNSFLNDVLERRTGIPISLSVLMIETGARLGITIEGVGFPGHFLVRAPGPGGPLLLDPFCGGRPLDERELLARYRRVSGHEPTGLPPAALETTGPLGILARMLRNLLRTYLDRGDHVHALEAVDLLLVLVPESAVEVRLRGLLYERLECFGPALADLQRYLALAPDAPDRNEIQRRIARLARTATPVH
jgi:regulator of sirC expression with transglutaminase-like and TPR domain